MKAYSASTLRMVIPPLASFSVFILTVLFISLAPNFDLLSWAISYDEKRIFELGLLLFTASVTLSSRQTTDSYLQSFLSLPALARWGLFIILILGTASSFLAPSPHHAFLEICLFGLLFSFAISVSALCRRHPASILVIFFSALLSSIFFYEITFFSGYIGTFIQSFPFDTRILFANFSNVRFLNQFQIWTLPLIALPLLLYRKKLNPRLFAFIFFLSISWWIIVFASRGRGIQLAIASSAFLTLLIFRKDAFPLMRLMGFSALLGGCAYLFLFIYLPESGQVVVLDKMMDDPARVQLWSSALSMIQQHPLLGVGPQHYAYYQKTIAAHPHNSLLQIAAEWGIPVAILFVSLFLWGGISWCKKYFDPDANIRRDEKKHVWIALFCSATAGMTYSLVSGVIVMPLSQVMFAAIMGMMLGLYNTTNTSTKTSTHPASTYRIFLLRLALACLVVYVPIKIAPDVITRYELPGPPYNGGHVAKYKPRFWQEGEIRLISEER